jgi:hypothetical protein
MKTTPPHTPRYCPPVKSALTLFVARLFANDAHGAIAPDDFTVPTNLLDRSPYFHFSTPD